VSWFASTSSADDVDANQETGLVTPSGHQRADLAGSSADDVERAVGFQDVGAHLRVLTGELDHALADLGVIRWVAERLREVDDQGGLVGRWGAVQDAVGRDRYLHRV